MIPRRLRLTNFMSHAETDVDFTGLHAAVLTGHNGAGKSSLLDAITWAMWGVARTAGDQVVRVGEAECAVELVVEVGGVTYTVRRRRSTHKSVPTSLEFSADGRPLTCSGVRETQAAITAAMGVDYDTFAASAFLGQGRADVFTASTPKARKELLGEVLGLGRYDVLAVAAREAAKTAATQAEMHRATVARLEDGAGDVEDVRRQLERAEAAVKTIEVSREEAEQEHTKLLTLTAKARGWQAEYDRNRAAAKVADDAATRTEAALFASRATLAGLQEKTAGHAAAKARFDGWQALAAEEGAAREKAEAWDKLDRAIGAASAARSATRAEKGRALAALDAGLALLPGLLASHVTASARLADAPDVTAEFEAAREAGAALEAKRVALVTRADGYAASAKSWDAKRVALETATQGEGCDAACPTCARPLTDAAMAEVRATMLTEARDYRDGQADDLAEAAKLAAEVALKREACERLRDQMRARVDLVNQVAQLDSQIAIVRRDEEVASSLAAEIAALDAPDPAVEAMQAQRDAVDFDAAHYAKLRCDLAALADAPAAWQEVQAAMLDLERGKAEVARLEAELTAHAEAMGRAKEAADAVALEAMTHDFAGLLAGLDVSVDESIREIASLRTAEREADRLVNDLDATIRRIEGEAVALADARVALDLALATEADYRTLTLAFGRNGIQAQAIEAAIPEIEEEANRLLADLGDNRTHVELVTQADLKGGGVKETLDVRISDDAGERPYEAYSGGEAFRVNFALRLALARLLARRSGAPLQLMVVDEGFGTQDEAGRTRLLQAINAVAPSFALILIVTHIRDLMDAFTQRIDVTKVGGVSKVKVAA